MAGKRILLVEDDYDVAPLLTHVLIGEGYAVDLATTRAEAWGYLDAHHYDLVIADWRLPDGDGTGIADAGAELGAKTVVMSGYLFRMPGGRVERHQTLMKPIRPSELVDIVRRAIGPAARYPAAVPASAVAPSLPTVEGQAPWIGRTHREPLEFSLSRTNARCGGFTSTCYVQTDTRSTRQIQSKAPSSILPRETTIWSSLTRSSKTARG